MESFFGRLKTECFYGREFNTREEIVNAVRDYLDYYNHRRIQLKLKGLSPIQYRLQSLCEQSKFLGSDQNTVIFNRTFYFNPCY